MASNSKSTTPVLKSARSAPPPTDITQRMQSANDANEEARLRQVFAEMDVDGDGRVTQGELRQFLARNPRGWPLADVFLAKKCTPNDRDQIILFWFRKLDIAGEGSFDITELLAFFTAMHSAQAQEHLFADFLLNLFDRNLDGRIDAGEYRNMLTVLFGAEPPKSALDAFPTGGMNRQELSRLLHSISCDFSLLPGMGRAAHVDTADGVTSSLKNTIKQPSSSSNNKKHKKSAAEEAESEGYAPSTLETVLLTAAVTTTLVLILSRYMPRRY